MLLKLNFPSGITQYSAVDGTLFRPDANGQVVIDSTKEDAEKCLPMLLDAGFSLVVASSTAGRPTTTAYPGQMWFDSTLGKPIWRNAANSGWVDATGTAA